MRCRSLSLPIGALILSLLLPLGASAETMKKFVASVPSTVTELTVHPTSIKLSNRYDYRQLLVMGKLSTGEEVDVTRMATMVPSDGMNQVVAVDSAGRVTAVGDGSGSVTVKIGAATATIPVSVKGFAEEYHPDYIKDVTPVIAKLGCSQGTCHGAKDGKNGFKLSLRGYDPLYDVRALTDDISGRRFNRAAPDQSLMLLKPAGVVPHQGGVLMQPGEPYYEILRKWIAEGSKLDLSQKKVSSIEVLPKNTTIPLAEMSQQIKVIATYPDGSKRDVTSEANISPSDIEILAIDEKGLVTALRRGEAAVLARYEGSYAATQIFVMGDRTGYAWQGVDAYNEVDTLVYKKQRQVKVLPSGTCTDAEFIRRLYLDLTGLPPTSKQVAAFLLDERATRVKRDELVDQLIGSPDFVDHWTNKWADMLQVNTKFLGQGGALALRGWIRNAIENNMPYDQFVHKVLTASGSTQENPPAAYYKTLRTPDLTMENTTQLFLSIRFNCNKCHDHPFERWTQNQYYDLAAYFAQVGRRGDPLYKGKTIGGTAVEKRQPLVEVIYDSGEGEVNHLNTGAVSKPTLPYGFEGLAEFSSLDEKQPAQPIGVDVAWIDDRQTNGGRSEGLWDYVTKSEGPVKLGELSRRQSGSGTLQHTFHEAVKTISLTKGDKLYAYVYLDPKDPPKQLMLQFYDGDWEQRVYWGEAKLPFTMGSDTSVAKYRQGDLPETGKWVRLEIDPEKVGILPGTMLRGMSFAQFGGTVHWDAAGVSTKWTPADAATTAPKNSRREQLARWMTHKDNPYFARSYVNRIWSYLLGVGMIEPVDDIRAGNPATNPELLDMLTEQFVESNFNVRELMTTICKSRTYQLSMKTNVWNDGDTVNYTHALARRLPAEVMYDALHRVTGTTSRLPGLPAGARAAELIDPNAKLSDGFLDQFGRPPRESACECERSTGVLLGPVMKLIMGPTVNDAIIDSDNGITKLVASEKDDVAVVKEIFMRVLNRPATREEILASVELMQTSLSDEDLKITQAQIDTVTAELDKKQPAWDAEISAKALGEVKISDWSRLGPLRDKSSNAAYAKSFFDETKPIDITQPTLGQKWVAKPDYKDAKVIPLDGNTSANYLYRTLDSPEERKAILYFGSDDGIRVWLNGKQIHALRVGRGVKPDNDKIAVTLKKGRNTLLLKINNGYGFTGFYFRTDANLAGLRLPEEVVKVFRVLPENRTAEHKKTLTDYFRMSDVRYRELQKVLAIHQRIVDNPRLVGAQDLVWALINSPAFVFNR